MRTPPLLETLEPRLLLDGMTPSSPAERIIDFAGMQWAVRDAEPAAQGDNWYSDSTDSVWVDVDGLHLKIRADGGTWYAAEVVTTQPTTYGVHRFYVTGRPDLLDGNVIADLSLVSDPASASIRLGGQPNGTYALEPAGGVEQLSTFDITLNGSASTYSLAWQPGEVQFAGHHWHSPEPATPSHVISQWQYAGADVPDVADDVRIRLGLSLLYALPPTDGNEVEIVIAAADVPNHVPTVESVVCDPNWLLVGEQLTAVAAGAADPDGAITRMEFFHDVDGDGIGQPAESLGVDTNGADGWSWTGPADWEAGTHTLLAQATDEHNASGPWAAGSVAIVAAPEIVVLIGTGEGAQGKALTFTKPDGGSVTVKLNAGLAALGFARPEVQILPGANGIVLAGGVRLTEVTLSETTRRSWLSFKVRGGVDKLVEVGRIVGDAPLGKLQAGQVDLIGSGVAMTGDGYIGAATVHDLLNGADLRMEGAGSRRGVAVTAAAVGPDSVINIVQGPIRRMKFTGEFSGVVSAGVSAGVDGLWFTDDDYVVNNMKVGPIRINRPGAGLDGDSFGVLAGPKGAKVIVPKAYRDLAGGDGFQTRVLPGANAAVKIIRVRRTSGGRAVTGRVVDVAISRYRVDLYLETDDGWTLVKSANLSRTGVWTARRVARGRLQAYLVARDVVAPEVLLEPLTCDGLMIVAETTRPA